MMKLLQSCQILGLGFFFFSLLHMVVPIASLTSLHKRLGYVVVVFRYKITHGAIYSNLSQIIQFVIKTSLKGYLVDLNLVSKISSKT